MKIKYFMFLLLATISYSQITNNLLLYYPFDGNSNDFSGNGYNGEMFNGVTFGNDRFGNPNSAVYFDGVNDYINLPNISQLKPNLPISFSFWIKYDSAFYGNQVVFNTSFEQNRSSGVWFNAAMSSNNYAINFGDGTYAYTSNTRRTLVSDNSVNVGVWHHIVIVVNSESDMDIYVDCNNVNGTYSGNGGSLFYSSTPGCIGRHDRDLSSPPDYFKGYLDDFRYWDRALLTNEINQLCSTLSISENNLSNLKFIVSPNPTSDFINIEANAEDFKSIVIYNTLGEEVYNGEFKLKIDISDFLSGIYFLKAYSESSFISTRILVK